MPDRRKKIRRVPAGSAALVLALFLCAGCGQREAEGPSVAGPVKQETAETVDKEQENIQMVTVQKEAAGPWINMPAAGEAAGPQKPSEAPLEPSAKPSESAEKPSKAPEEPAETSPPDTVSPTAEPPQTPVPTATETPPLEPVITPVPLPGSAREDGTLSKPDHPETVANDRLIFIGDSRTEGIRDAVNDTSIWSCLSGKGYDWMVTTGVPQVESEIGQNTAVIFLMGVNDLYHVSSYINYISEKANEWSALGARTYYVSVGPVESDPYVTNAQIESFNTSMENGLAGVKYIDLYAHLTENGFSTVDGLHYTENVSVEIYNYIIENLEEVRSGIWG